MPHRLALWGWDLCLGTASDMLGLPSDEQLGGSRVICMLGISCRMLFLECRPQKVPCPLLREVLAFTSW